MRNFLLYFRFVIVPQKKAEKIFLSDSHISYAKTVLLDHDNQEESQQTTLF